MPITVMKLVYRRCTKIIVRGQSRSQIEFVQEGSSVKLRNITSSIFLKPNQYNQYILYNLRLSVKLKQMLTGWNLGSHSLITSHLIREAFSIIIASFCLRFPLLHVYSTILSLGVMCIASVLCAVDVPLLFYYTIRAQHLLKSSWLWLHASSSYNFTTVHYIQLWKQNKRPFILKSASLWCC